MRKKKHDYFGIERHELRDAAERVIRLFDLRWIKEEIDSIGLEATVQNEVAGIRFEFVPQDGPGWHAVVGRLVEDEFPRHPVFISRDTVLHYFDIRSIAKRNLQQVPELSDKLIAKQPLSVQDICLLAERCCADILRGDFSSFAELSEQVMRRVDQLALENSSRSSKH